MKYDWDKRFIKFIENNKTKINSKMYSKEGIQLYRQLYDDEQENSQDFEITDTYKNRMSQRKSYIGVRKFQILKDLFYYCSLLSVSPGEILNFSSSDNTATADDYFYYHLSETVIIKLEQTLKEYQFQGKRLSIYDSFVLPLITHIESGSVMYLFYSPTSDDKLNYIMSYKTYGKLKTSCSDAYNYKKHKELSMGNIIILNNNFTDAKDEFVKQSGEKKRNLRKAFKKSLDFMRDCEDYEKLLALDTTVETLFEAHKMSASDTSKE